MAVTVSVDEANDRFSQLLAQVITGHEEVIIAKEGTPVARLVPAEAKPARRVPGMDAGKVYIAPDFDDPLPDDIVDAFYEGNIEP